MMGVFKASRYHDISCGHRVSGHEGKCRFLHGHNYRIHFNCASKEEELDEVGRVIDFSVIKSTLCEWVEVNWDHHFLVWDLDAWAWKLIEIDPSVVLVSFNPTAENMAEYLVTVVGPDLLPKEIRLVSVTVEETRKCSAHFEVKL